jgi:hypothetical protein
MGSSTAARQELAHLRACVPALQAAVKDEEDRLRAEIKKTEQEIRESPERKLVRLQFELGNGTHEPGKALGRARSRIEALERLLGEPVTQTPEDATAACKRKLAELGMTTQSAGALTGRADAEGRRVKREGGGGFTVAEPGEGEG